MSYTVGQQVDLQTVVNDANGNPIDATVTLVVTRPDGTTANPTVTHPSTGTYIASTPTTIPGTYTYLWTASGAATGVDSGQFEVVAAVQRIISLEDAKRHLNKKLTDTANDEELLDFIDAAQAMIEREIGPVLPRVYTEMHDGGVHRISLWHGPMVSVTSISEYLYGSLIRVLTTNEFTTDLGAGSVARILSGGYPAVFQGAREDVKITYVAGRAQPIPANIRLGARELTAHLWRNTQIGRTSRGRNADVDDIAPMGMAFSMPNRVRELIGAKRPVIF